MRESSFGITPNGYADPDYLGWEIKQYAAKDFTSFRATSPVTLMMPEPTGGIYKSEGVIPFLRRFGYPDKKGRPDRINFGGIYTCHRRYHQTTGLRMVLEGFDQSTG